VKVKFHAVTAILTAETVNQSENNVGSPVGKMPPTSIPAKAYILINNEAGQTSVFVTIHIMCETMGLTNGKFRHFSKKSLAARFALNIEVPTKQKSPNLTIIISTKGS